MWEMLFPQIQNISKNCRENVQLNSSKIAYVLKNLIKKSIAGVLPGAGTIRCVCNSFRAAGIIGSSAGDL